MIFLAPVHTHAYHAAVLAEKANLGVANYIERYQFLLDITYLCGLSYKIMNKTGAGCWCRPYRPTTRCRDGEGGGFHTGAQTSPKYVFK